MLFILFIYGDAHFHLKYQYEMSKYCFTFNLLYYISPSLLFLSSKKTQAKKILKR